MPEVRLIDRTAIMEQLRVIEQNGKLTDAQKFRLAEFVVENAPTIKPKVRHGRWIPKDSKTAKCSYCGWWQHARMYYLPDDIAAFSKCYRFCTSCGTDMREDGGADNGNG